MQLVQLLRAIVVVTLGSIPGESLYLSSSYNRSRGAERLDVGDQQQPLDARKTSDQQFFDHRVRVRNRFFAISDDLQGSVIPPGSTRHPLWHFEAFQLSKARVWISCVILFFAGMLCSAGGIGGGGVYVTVLMVAGGLDISDAVPLSKAVVFLGAIVSLVLNLRKSFSSEDVSKASLMDYNICRLVVPAALGGTYIGVLLNRIFPSWLIGLILTLVLLAITVMVGRTTLRQWQEERAQGPGGVDPSAELQVADGGADQSTGLPEDKSAMEQGVGAAQLDTQPAAVGAGTLPAGSSTHTTRGQRASMVVKSSAPALKSRRFTWHAGPQGFSKPAHDGKAIDTRSYVACLDILLAFLVLFVVVLFSAFRFHAGACQHATPSTQYERCHHPVFAWLGKDTLERWMHQDAAAEFLSVFSFVFPLVLCLAVVTFYSHMLCSQQAWAFKEVLTYDAMALSTGILAGLVGIGGGLIISPFLLLMNLEPAVAVATSSTCVLFTSSSTTLQYLLSDRIIMSLTFVYGVVNLVASYAGTTFVHMLQEKMAGRRSYISCVVGLGVLLSTVLSLIQLFKTAMSKTAVAH